MTIFYKLQYQVVCNKHLFLLEKYLKDYAQTLNASKKDPQHIILISARLNLQT